MPLISPLMPVLVRKYGVCFFLSHSEACALFVQGGYTLNRYCVVVYWWLLMQFRLFLEETVLSDVLLNAYVRR